MSDSPSYNLRNRHVTPYALRSPRGMNRALTLPLPQRTTRRTKKSDYYEDENDEEDEEEYQDEVPAPSRRTPSKQASLPVVFVQREPQKSNSRSYSEEYLDDSQPEPTLADSAATTQTQEQEQIQPVDTSVLQTKLFQILASSPPHNSHDKTSSAATVVTAPAAAPSTNIDSQQSLADSLPSFTANEHTTRELFPEPRFLPTTASEEILSTPAVKPEQAAEKKESPVLSFAFFFLLAVAVLYIIIKSLPEFELEKHNLNLPVYHGTLDTQFWSELYDWSKSLEHWKELADVLQAHVRDHLPIMVLGYSALYIFFQSFAIPGSTSLSLIGGAVFGFWPTLVLVCACTAIGASNCYLMSGALGDGLVDRLLHQRIVGWRLQIDRHREDLLSYMLFLRVTPFLPNWFINLASPHVGIPFNTFILATFLGAFPLALMPVLAGTSISELSSWKDVQVVYNQWPYVNPKFALIVFVAAVASLLPILIRVKFATRFQH